MPRLKRLAIFNLILGGLLLAGGAVAWIWQPEVPTQPERAFVVFAVVCLLAALMVLLLFRKRPGRQVIPMDDSDIRIRERSFQSAYLSMLCVMAVSAAWLVFQSKYTESVPTRLVAGAVLAGLLVAPVAQSLHILIQYGRRKPAEKQ